MYSEAALVLAKKNSLVSAGGDDSLIIHEDYLTCSVLKVFIKEKELCLQQGLHACEKGILVGYFLKRFNPTRQPFAPHESYQTEKSLEQKKPQV